MSREAERLQSSFADLTRRIRNVESLLLATDKKIRRHSIRLGTCEGRTAWLHRVKPWFHFADHGFWSSSAIVVVVLGVCSFIGMVFLDLLLRNPALGLVLGAGGGIALSVAIHNGTRVIQKAAADVERDITYCRQQLAILWKEKQGDTAELSILYLERDGLKRRIEQLEASFEYWRGEVEKKNAPLMRESWRSYRGVQFEKWLANLFENLGASVELTKASGDGGIDLVVRFQHGSYGVQAKGYPATTVGNKAVQEAHTGSAIYGLKQAVVVTNSTYTRQAISDAEKVGCLMISLEEIPSLAMGRLREFRARQPA